MRFARWIVPDSRLPDRELSDVVLAEDVLSSRVAHYWAPDSQHVAFATFDDTDVTAIEYPLYMDSTHVYPRTVHIKYPKVCLQENRKFKPEVPTGLWRIGHKTNVMFPAFRLETCQERR